MPLYKYKAKKGPNDFVEGEVTAKSEAEAIEKISQLGYFPVKIESAEEPVPVGEFPLKAVEKIKYREITIFTRQLATLLKSGVPILQSLSIIAEQSPNPRLRNVLRIVHDAIKEGATFSSALAQFPLNFTPLYVAMVRSGENSGAISTVLLRIADYRARQEEIRSRFRLALAYPLLMVFVGCVTIIFMFTFVMPRLIVIFNSLGQALPLPTRILISIADGLRLWKLWALLFLILLLLQRQSKTPGGRLYLSRLKLNLPLVGALITKSELSRFSRTLELLIKSGVPVFKSLSVAIPVLTNEVIKKQLQNSYTELEQGGSFGKSLRRSKLFPAFMSNLIIVGEESGKLDEALAEIANTYDRDTDEALKVTSSLLEPLTILFMGLIVGFIVIAMLLPVFEINIGVR